MRELVTKVVVQIGSICFVLSLIALIANIPQLHALRIA